jgi:hypothetical protein
MNKQHLLAAATAILALLTCAPANAFTTTCISDCLTFDFSFTSSVGTVTGVITGLYNNEPDQQGAVTITSYPSALGSLGTPPLSVTSPRAPTPGFDNFNVTSGEITSALYYQGEPNFLLAICTFCEPEQYYLIPSGIGPPPADIADQITFTPVTSATPLPAAFPLFATGLATLGLLGWRRKRKVQAVAA